MMCSWYEWLSEAVKYFSPFIIFAVINLRLLIYYSLFFDTKYANIQKITPGGTIAWAKAFEGEGVPDTFIVGNYIYLA